MYGCPCYKYNDKLFVFLLTDGVVLTKASDQDKMKLSKEFSIKLFRAVTKTMKGWPQIPVDETTDLKKIIPFIKNSYNQSKIEVLKKDFYILKKIGFWFVFIEIDSWMILKKIVDVS
jgi:hypothetical protein